MNITEQPQQSAEPEPDALPEFDTHGISLLLLGLILIFSLALRYYRAEEPFGGYLSYNEGWYAVISRNYETHGLLKPTSVFGVTDYNVAPFYSYLLYAVKVFYGESERNFRLVSILFSEISIIFIFLLGGLMFSAEAGLIAAALYGFATVSVVVGRNVQTDAVYLAFLLASLYFYLTADSLMPVRRAFNELCFTDHSSLATDHYFRRPARMALSGLCLGFAFFTKQFAILLIPAVLLWECLRHRGIRWIGWRHLWFAVCALAVPAPFFVYHLVVSAGRVFRAQTALAGSEFVLPGIKEAAYIFWEFFWGFSPLIFLLCAVAVIAGIFRKGSYRLLLLAVIGVFFVFFSFWHPHSYYILYAVPFAALLAGDLLSSVRRKGVLVFMVVMVCVVSTVHAVAYLCNVKYGYDAFKTLGNYLDAGSGVTLILSPGVEGNYRPLVHYYLHEAEILTEKELEKRHEKNLTFLSGKKIYVISLAGRPAKDFPEPSVGINRRISTLVLLGFRIYVVSESEHFFRIVKVGIMRIGRLQDAGVPDIGLADDLLLSPLSAATRYKIQSGRVMYY